VKFHLEDPDNSNILVFDDGFEDGTLDPFSSSDWTVTNTVHASGSYSAQSGGQGTANANSRISLSVQIPSGGSSFSFAYKVSSEENYDYLRFYIDGDLQDEWSGEVDWSTYTGSLTEGNHTLTWAYEKDGSVDDYDDTGYIDDVHIDAVNADNPQAIFRIVDGMQGEGKILVSDANGNAYWKTSEEAGVSKWKQNGDNIYNANTGNVGVGTSSPAYLFHVDGTVAGNAVLYAENHDNTEVGSFGIHGITHSVDEIGSAGVFGESVSSGDHEIGMMGDYAFWGVAVAGIGWLVSVDDIPSSGGSSGQTNDIGVYGGVDFETGIGVYGYNPDSDGYAGYFDGNLTMVNGTKNASVPTSKGNQLMYSMESPEIWFEDFGSGQLNNGEVHITLDEMFLETVYIDDEHPMHVFVQEQGESNGLYVIPDADGRGFTVKERAGGTGNIKFSYRIIAKRRFFQDHRFGVDPLQGFGNNLQKAHYHPPRTTNPEEMQKIIREAEQRKQMQVQQPAENRKPVKKKKRK
jgi:hypothetical protein